MPRRRECSPPGRRRKNAPPPPSDPLWCPHRSRSGPESPENHSGLPQNSGRVPPECGAASCPAGRRSAPAATQAWWIPDGHGARFSASAAKSLSVGPRYGPRFLKIASLEHSTFCPPGKGPFLFSTAVLQPKCSYRVKVFVGRGAFHGRSAGAAGAEIPGDDPGAGGPPGRPFGLSLHHQHAGDRLLQHGGHLFRGHDGQQRRHRLFLRPGRRALRGRASSPPWHPCWVPPRPSFPMPGSICGPSYWAPRG